jgi:hypothetical protein
MTIVVTLRITKSKRIGRRKKAAQRQMSAAKHNHWGNFAVHTLFAVGAHAVVATITSIADLSTHTTIAALLAASVLSTFALHPVAAAADAQGSIILLRRTLLAICAVWLPAVASQYYP